VISEFLEYFCRVRSQRIVVLNDKNGLYAIRRAANPSSSSPPIRASIWVRSPTGQSQLLSCQNHSPPIQLRPPSARPCSSTAGPPPP